MNWLFGAVFDFVKIVRDQRVGEIDSRLGDVPRGGHGALVRMREVLVPDVLARMSQALMPHVLVRIPEAGATCPPSAAAIVVADIAGVAVVVAVASPGVIVGAAKDVIAAKDVVAVEVEAAPMNWSCTP